MNSLLQDHTALVLFSGGQDSSTCLAWALSRFGHVSTLGFDYGQRHATELQCRRRVREALAALRPDWAARLEQDTVLALDTWQHSAPNALTADLPLATLTPEGLPNTFVPGRNLIFLLHAAVWAYALPVRHLVLGVCQSDSSGYPDCTDDSMKALQTAINVGMGTHYTIHTPLMWRSKAHTWHLAHQLGGDALVNLLVEESHTCYMGDRQHRHAWGYGCGVCPACTLRAAGYRDYCRQKAETARENA